MLKGVWWNDVLYARRCVMHRVWRLWFPIRRPGFRVTQRCFADLQSQFPQSTSMNPPAKPLSLANIHSIYSGIPDKQPKPAPVEPSTQVYKTTNQFARDSAHTGVAPSKPLAPGTRFRR
jgi:hypothetical protein